MCESFSSFAKATLYVLFIFKYSVTAIEKIVQIKCAIPKIHNEHRIHLLKINVRTASLLRGAVNQILGIWKIEPENVIWFIVIGLTKF